MSVSSRRGPTLSAPVADVAPPDRAELVRLLELVARQLAPQAEQPTDRRAVLHRRAEAMFRCRMDRKSYFAAAMFGEPAWDVLLSLYIGEPAIDAMTVSRVAPLIQMPLSSTLRWVDYLEAQHLIVRRAHPTDGRSSMIRLTDSGRTQLELYLSGTLEIMA